MRLSKQRETHIMMTQNPSWPSAYAGWILQAQTNTLQVGIGTNWVTVPGSDSVNQMSIPIDPANESVFFRLVSP